MVIKLACVQFAGERDKKILPVSDVSDFHPKAKNDFNPKQDYQIQWPVLRRQDSDTTHELYTGKIFLLAANPESMVKQAKEKGIKLPAAFLKSVLEKKDKKQDAKIDPKASSKRAREQVHSARVSAHQKTMKEIKDLHEQGQKNMPSSPAPTIPIERDYPSSSKKSNKSLGFPNTAASKSDDQGADKDPHSNLISCQSNCSKETKKKFVDSNPAIKTKEKHDDFSPAFETKEKHDDSNPAIQTKESPDGSKCEKRKNVGEHGNGKKIKGRSVGKGKRSRRGLESDSSSCDSYVSSTRAIQQKLEERNKKLMEDLARERKKARVAETEANSLRLALSQWETAYAEFQKLKPVPPPTPSKFYSTVSNWVTSTLHYTDTTKMGRLTPGSFKVTDTAKKNESEVIANTGNQPHQKVSPNLRSPPKADEKAPSLNVSSAKRRIDFDERDSNTPSKKMAISVDGGSPSPGKIKTPGKSNPETLEVPSDPQVDRNGPDKKNATPDKDSKKPQTCTDTHSPKKIKKGKKVKKSPKKTALGPGEISHKEIAANIILPVLEGKKALEYKKQGEVTKVLLGNDIYIKEDVWRHRILPEKAKLSLLTGDLVEEMFGWRKCATMSTKGGVSPKAPGAPRKEPIPGGALEVIQGVYWAKLMHQGMTNEVHLQQNLKACNETIASKLKTCARKLKDEQNKSSAS